MEYHRGEVGGGRWEVINKINKKIFFARSWCQVPSWSWYKQKFGLLAIITLRWNVNVSVWVLQSAGVAQLGRALDWRSKGPRFNPGFRHNVFVVSSWDKWTAALFQTIDLSQFASSSCPSLTLANYKNRVYQKWGSNPRGHTCPLDLKPNALTTRPSWYSGFIIHVGRFSVAMTGAVLTGATWSSNPT